MNTWFACAITFSFLVVLGPLLPTYIKRSRRKTIVFDSHRNQVLVNGHVFCTIEDLSFVKLDQDRKKSELVSFRPFAPYLETAAGETSVIDESAGAGPSLIELEEIGQSIADFTGVVAVMT